MSLYLYLSHIGKRYDVDVSNIQSPEVLKQWIANNVDVPIGRQILMTGAGKNVKQQHLVNHGEIFIYDKRFLLGEEPSPGSQEEDPPASDLEEPPSELENETSLSAWLHLFKSRRAWALRAVELVRNSSEGSDELSQICENIDRSANVALDNLKNHVSSLQNLFEKTQAWAQDTLQEQAELLREWRAMTETLKELPIRDDIGRLMSVSQNDNANGAATETIYALLDQHSLENAHTTLESSSENFRSQVDEIAEAMAQLSKDSNAASALVQIEWPNPDTGSLVQEAETIAKKIDGDYNDVLRAAPDTKAISKISRVAAGHTNSLLPGLQELVQEGLQAHKSLRQHRHRLSGICFGVLRSISQIQSILAGLQRRVSTLTVSEDAQASFEVLDRVFRLPSAYGSILIEAIRRSEWNDRTVADFRLLKEELSYHKDDEVRRRKKWTNNMITFLKEDIAASSATAAAISDFSFSTTSNPWPFVSREEIFSYVDDLRALEIVDAVEQVTQQLRDLDVSVKSRRTRPRPFKNGSIHDTMQNSFMRNGSPHADEVKTLQDEKYRLEDKLRASESRIRKLEDVLHRQSQAQTSQSNLNRTPSGIFTPITASDFERQPHPPSPEPNNRAATFDPAPLSRRSSVSHARRLSNQNLEEKALVQRIVSLESQVNTLKNDSETSMKALQETESVKRDLLANFESQRQEFDDERQRLEDDNHELKIKLEELEEELDRIVGSKDHEKMTQEQAVSHLRSELERVKRITNDEVERLRNTRDKLERDLSLQKDKYNSTESQMQHLRSERSSLQDRNLELANDLRGLESRQANILGTLQSVHEHLSPAGSAPEDLKRLASALEVLAEGATIHARGLDDTLQLATAQGKASAEQIEQLEARVSKLLAEKLDVEARICDKDEKLKQAQHSLNTLKSELIDERRQIEHLRAQFAAGETGSDTLRNRLAEEEKRVANLTDIKDKSEVQVEILQQNLSALRDDLADLNKRADQAQSRHVSRQKKARDLSERLFQNNDRMIRMLEGFGYSITRDGSVLVMQRASKVNASQILGDTMLGAPMKRQISGSMPIQHYSDSTDAETLYWTHDGDGHIEDIKYEAFLAAVSRLDIDSTIELVTKRYKDVESLAKKYQRDSRLHREKTHRLQSEAHEKIAYRSFKEGDLALFLPTRNQATKPWAAFNVGAPHYFLKEVDSHRLQSRDWLLARISKIEERVVDLSRSMGNASTRGNADASASDGASLQSIDDNPFELSDGLRWYMIEASEEKAGAPSTPGLAKSTVAASVIEVKAQMGRKPSGIGGKDSDRSPQSAVNATKTLHKSLDSRRSSEASRKSGAPLLRASTSNSNAVATLTTAGIDGEAEGVMSPAVLVSASGPGPNVKPSDADQRQQRAREDDRIFDVVRKPALNTASLGSESVVTPTKSIRAGTESQRNDSPSEGNDSGKDWDKLFSFQFQA